MSSGTHSVSQGLASGAAQVASLPASSGPSPLSPSPLSPHSSVYHSAATVSAKPKTSLMASVLKGFKNFVMGIILLLTLWLAFSFGLKSLKNLFRTEEKPAEVKSFSLEDSVSFSPQLGVINEVSSDKTVDAILSGTFGPVVVMFHAEWCGHCKNMEPAYAAAAKDSALPFVKVSGASAPVSSNKYAVTGYPTVFGVSSLGLLSRYANARTAEALLEFTRLLAPKESSLAPTAATPQAPQAPHQATPAVAASSATVTSVPSSI